MSNNKDTRVVVLNTFEAFRTAIKSKKWEPFLECFSDDIAFWEPVSGEYNGKNTGKDKLRSFYEGQGNRMDLKIDDPLSVTVEGNQAVVEYEEKGTLDGNPFSNRVAISYVVEDGKIVLSREYLGDMS